MEALLALPLEIRPLWVYTKGGLILCTYVIIRTGKQEMCGNISMLSGETRGR